MAADAIYTSLMSAAAALPLGYPIAWEDVPFQKPLDTQPRRVQHMPVASGLRSSGILQIDVNRPSGYGAAGLLQDVVVITNHFADRKTFDGFYVHHHTLSGVWPEDGWSSIAVSIHYRSST